MLEIALAGSYFIYSAIASALQKGSDVEYLKTQGRLAHSLKEPELICYAELIGPDAVADEIAEAYRDGKTITPAARKFLIAMGEASLRLHEAVCWTNFRPHLHRNETP